jgi:hypothetical protein
MTAHAGLQIAFTDPETDETPRVMGMILILGHRRQGRGGPKLGGFNLQNPNFSRIDDLRINPAPPAPLRGQPSAELNRGLSSISFAKHTYLQAKGSTKVL